MTLPPPEFAENLANASYLFPPSHYSADNVPQQIRAKLERQRRQGVEFELAWQQTIGRDGCHLRMPQQKADRDQWRALFEDAAYVEVWAAAYERREHKAVTAAGHMQAVFEPESDEQIRAGQRELHEATGARAA
jgi:hypothetical protein